MEKNEPNSSNENRVEENCMPSEDWEPPPEQIIHLFETLERDGVLPLKWQCPGRRAPQDFQEEYSDDDDEQEQEDINTDFDFDAEDSSGGPKLTPRRTGGLKGSARKKTTSLDSVINSMRRHKQVDVMERAKGFRIPKTAM